ncbi:Cof-type HAD-IIB family hydrolase [Heyndrickxia acidicola]|uniref:Cof-type HAD-IIB family hydrolase n=1 Tax=Heyndrickxia acidicola TaxID=209389 RepID=A0ABU6MKX4_9BACI|nr:Cof-type HAD-IIB family hydrolase [Heyndrickxia acidicola]MED1205336.1 Cof-type HAD-IIB family hydrolase [Heyndrickxia acidicola]
MKLIALDMDGTTLSSENQISIENIEAIKAAQEQGHVVMILSGRAPESINAVQRKYGLNCPIGGSNGTAVFAGGKLIELTSLAAEQNKAAVEVIEKESMPYKLYTNKGIYFHNDWKNRMERVIASGAIPAEFYEDENYGKMTRIPDKSEGVTFFDDLDTLLKDEELAIQKIFILALNPEQRNRVLTSMKTIDGVYVTISSPFNIEIMNINGNKGNGLKVMAEYFNIPLKDTVAIGDQQNDVPMFKVAGLSIAMGNAAEEIQKMCDFVTLTNDENGVAHAIHHYVLKDKIKETEFVLD